MYTFHWGSHDVASTSPILKLRKSAQDQCQRNWFHTGFYISRCAGADRIGRQRPQVFIWAQGLTIQVYLNEPWRSSEILGESQHQQPQWGEIRGSISSGLSRWWSSQFSSTWCCTRKSPIVLTWTPPFEISFNFNTFQKLEHGAAESRFDPFSSFFHCSR